MRPAVGLLLFMPYIVFKGGTSLSKCHKVIRRFSEDIDITIDTLLSQGQKKKIKQAIVDSAQELGMTIENLDETRSRRDYNRYVIASDTIKPRLERCGADCRKVAFINQEMGWDSECRYKMLGYRITFEGETLYVFDLLVPEIFHEGQRRKKNAADSQDNTAATKPVDSRKGFYPDDIVGTFGVPVEEHRKESEVQQMDGYVSMGILTGKIVPEAGKD